VIHLTGNRPDDAAESLRRLLELQNDFASRLYADTLSYLRGLQGVSSSASPGTVVLVESETLLEAEGQPGGSVRLAVQVVNEQSVYAVVAPALSSLVSESGVTWFPDATWIPPYQLVEPHESSVVTVEISLPAETPSATYRGAILFPGNRETVGVAIRVSEAAVPDGAVEQEETAST